MPTVDFYSLPSNPSLFVSHSFSLLSFIQEEAFVVVVDG
jgi:hypothetical protein